jgi:preprotein translocase subunit SecG
MLTFLLVIHAIVTATLVGVILMQRSEGGGLGMGGSPTGLMSARGAADFLTRATTILASLFVILSIISAVVASRSASSKTIDTSLARTLATAPAAPVNGDPLAAVAAGNNAAPVIAAPVPVPGPVSTETVRAVTPHADEPKGLRKPVAAPVTSRPEAKPAPKVEKPPVVTTTVPTPAPAPAPVTTPSGNSN